MLPEQNLPWWRHLVTTNVPADKYITRKLIPGSPTGLSGGKQSLVG